MSDLGAQGGNEAAKYKKPDEAGTPKTGFDSAPKSEVHTFHTPKGIGGSNRGAH